MLFALVLTFVIQSFLISVWHFGELDTFWFIVLEIVMTPACIFGLVMGYFSSLDWR